MTDTEDVFAYKPSINRPSCGFNANPKLMLRCKEGSSQFAIIHDCFLMANSTDGDLHVRLRFDKDAPHRYPMRASTNGKALGIWTDSQFSGWMRMLAKKQILTMEVPTRMDGVHHVSFDLSGISDVLAHNGSACGWQDILND